VTFNASDNIQYIKWPTERVLAFTTNRLPTQKKLLPSKAESSSPIVTNEYEASTTLTPEFDAFNLGVHVGDCPDLVIQNRKLLLKYLPSETKIQWLTQVHGNKVAKVEHHDNNPIVADAAITRSQGIALAIMTADCLPILLSNRDGSEIAAIHAGWRPLAANIIEETITLMQSSVNDIVVWMGPCIGEQVFEVGQEVKQAFCQVSTQFEQAFKLIKSLNDDPIKYLANLHLIAQLQLLNLGVKNITTLNECTHTLRDKYYSYRRDGQTGRMGSIIVIK
jgi:YfiH family protein|tara:strand:+ start:2896 stop:3729 length:834 start_codon:yes stop_codon:yes gene_type:complete